MSKRVLITGGAGFIGSNLTSQLLELGEYRITCIDNLDADYAPRQKEGNIEPFLQNPDYTFLPGDIRNPDDLEAIGEIDIIVHLAAKVGVRRSVVDAAGYYETNLSGTLNLLEFAKARRIRQFVFASSSSVYGRNSRIPWSEEGKPNPISPYAAAKLSAETLGLVYSHLYKIRFLALRFFSVYGMAQRPDLAIHSFFDAIHSSRPVAVFGDGSSSRDYTFIDDITSGIVAAMNYDSSLFEIINLGSSRSVALTELIHTIEKVCGKEAMLHHYPEQAGDLNHTCADISKAHSLLGYSPSTELYTGLTRFYDWYLKKLGDYSKIITLHDK